MDISDSRKREVLFLSIPWVCLFFVFLISTCLFSAIVLNSVHSRTFNECVWLYSLEMLQTCYSLVVSFLACFLLVNTV